MKTFLIVAAVALLSTSANAMCETKGTVTPHVEANIHSSTLPPIDGEVFIIAEKRRWVFVDIHTPGVGFNSPFGTPWQIHGGWIRQKEFECKE